MSDSALSAAAQHHSDVKASGLKALNIAREAFDDAGYTVSAPGDSEAGEFYLSLDGIDFAVRVEQL